MNSEFFSVHQKTNRPAGCCLPWSQAWAARGSGNSCDRPPHLGVLPHWRAHPLSTWPEAFGSHRPGSGHDTTWWLKPRPPQEWRQHRPISSAPHGVKVVGLGKGALFVSVRKGHLPFLLPVWLRGPRCQGPFRQIVPTTLCMLYRAPVSGAAESIFHVLTHDILAPTGKETAQRG